MKYIATFLLALSLTTIGSTKAHAQAAGNDKDIQFNNSGSLDGSDNLIWDLTSSLLGLDGTSATVQALDRTSGDDSGILFNLFGSSGHGEGSGGSINMFAGHADYTSSTGGRGGDLTLAAGNTNHYIGGDAYLLAGQGNGGTYDGGNVYIGSATAGPSGGNGGSIVLTNYAGTNGYFNSGSIDLITGTGFLRLKHFITGAWATFDPSHLTSDRVFKLPDASGTLGLREISEVQTGNSDYVINPSNPYSLIGVDDTSSVRTVTLPVCDSSSVGMSYTIKDESGAAGTNSITILPDGTDTVNGASSTPISQDYGSVEVYCSLTSGAWFTK